MQTSMNLRSHFLPNSIRLSLAVCLAIGLVGAKIAQAEKIAPTETNVSYGPHTHQVFDVFLPARGKPPYPVVICYGALWNAGKDPRCAGPYLPLGIAVVAVESRTLGDAMAEKIRPPISWPMLDARRVVQFVRLHAARWKLDPNRIALSGASQSALPALYVACAGEKANPNASDPVERVSTKVLGVAVLGGQPSIDPKRMQQWVPGVEWGAPSFGMSFAESLARYDEMVPIIKEWSPDALLNKDTPPIYFFNNDGLTRPAKINEMVYKVHSPAWGLGFQRLALERGNPNVYVQFPGHNVKQFPSFPEFIRKILIPASQ
jgi:hypothetical protein